MDSHTPVPGAGPDPAQVHLVDGPYVTYRGVRLDVPQGSKRLLALLSLRRGPVKRPYAAGVLWPHGGEERAAGNLRSALWRLRRADIDVVVADKWTLGLAATVAVDVEHIGDWARRLTHGLAEPDDLTLTRNVTGALDLLPGWYDDWAIIERERTRQRVLHALEAMSRKLTELRRYADAVEVAAVAVAAEPLRETAQRVLLEAHLSEGNRAAAEYGFAAFHTLLRRELGIEPSVDLAGVLSDARRASRVERVAFDKASR